MIETLLGGLLGGVFRVVPEFLKWLDAKDERKHELAMQDKAIEFQKLKGDQVIDEIETQGQADWNTGALDALKESIIGQMAKTGVRWIDGLSSSVRPIVTYWFMALYCSAKMAIFITAIQNGSPWTDAIALAWTEADQALWAGILNFWFLGRVFDRIK
jgi:hypothetical protein